MNPATNQKSTHVVLASASPRRRELLSQIGISYQLLPQDLDESPEPGESPENLVVRLATSKALAGVAACGESRALILGADTIVVCDGQILGKPVDRNDGLAMMAMLSGREHIVMTAVALAHAGRCESRLSVSTVYFRVLTEQEREAYWDSGEPQGKAGGYAIQGLAAMFIQRLEGSYSGIVGLPIYETVELLRSAGVDICQLTRNTRV
jgi:septum formation protein